MAGGPPPKLPTSEEILAAVAEQAANMPPPEPDIPDYGINSPPPGAIQALIEVQGIEDAEGRKFVRTVWTTVQGITIIDLPVENNQGHHVAENVGVMLQKAGHTMRTGIQPVESKLVVPR